MWYFILRFFFPLHFFQIPFSIYFSFFHFIIDKKELDIEMAHLVAASVEVKGDVAEEGNGNENDGRQVRRQSENANKSLHLFLFCMSI